MKTIVILTRRDGAEGEAFARLHRPELRAVWDGLESGVLRAVHGLAQGAGAVLEMETATLDEVRDYVASLPYVEEQLLDVHLCPLKPFVGLKDLFADT